MNKFLILLVLLLLFSITLQSGARDNPFTSKKPVKERSIKLPAVATKIVGKIIIWQEKLNTELTKRVKVLKDDKSFKALLPLIFISFLYGVAHAAGPGHGKVVVFSYFVSQKANFKKGMFLGFLIGIFHAISGIVIVLSLYYIIKTTYLASFENISRHVKVISYSLVLLVGLFLLINSLFNITEKLFKNKKTEKESETKEKNKSLLPIALAVGIVPCPGVVIIMLFALSFNLLFIGISMSLLMALGMGITIMIAGLISILGRKGLVKSTAGKQKVQHYIHKSLTVFGSLLITLFGGTLLAGTM